MAEPFEAGMKMMLDGEECDTKIAGETTVLCQNSNVFSKNVNLRLIKDGILVLNQDFSVEVAELKISSVDFEENSLQDKSRLKIVFETSISCLGPENFFFNLKSLYGSFEISNSDEKEMSSPNMIFVTLPEAQWEADEELKLETFFSQNGDRKKINETNLSLQVK
jgi:hypothetical protein